MQQEVRSLIWVIKLPSKIKKTLRSQALCTVVIGVIFLSRFKRIIQRTSKYTPLLFKKRKFDSTGSFATANQFYSSFLTLIMISLFFFSFFDRKLNIGPLILILFYFTNLY